MGNLERLCGHKFRIVQERVHVGLQHAGGQLNAGDVRTQSQLRAVRVAGPTIGRVEVQVQVGLDLDRQERIGQFAPGTVAGYRGIELRERLNGLQRGAVHIDDVIAGHAAGGYFVVDLLEDTVKLGRARVAIAIEQQVFGVGQQLLGAVHFLDRNRLGQVVGQVQHVADLTQGHQKFHQTDFAAVLALRRPDHAQLAVGRTAQEATDGLLTGEFVDNRGRVGLLQFVEQDKMPVFLNRRLHGGVKALNAQGFAAGHAVDIGCVITGVQGLGQFGDIAQVAQRATDRSAQGSRAAGVHAGKLAN